MADIFATGLAAGSADLVTVHQVLHYLGDPAAAVAEASRLVAPSGRLLIVDFAPHDLEYLREQHQHRPSSVSPTRRLAAGWRSAGSNWNRPAPCRPGGAGRADRQDLDGSPSGRR